MSKPVRATAADHATPGSARPDESAESPPPKPPRTAGRPRGRPLSPALDERILDAALDMLAENGYAGLRLDALAARAGVAKTTILRRWPSKAIVAAAAVERLALQTTDVPESGILREDLHALLTSAVSVFTHGRGSFVPRLIRESGHHLEIASLLDTVIHTRRLAYRRVLGRAIARHDLDPDVDQELLIDLLVGPIWTRLLITHDPITPTLINEIVDAVGPARLCKSVSRLDVAVLAIKLGRMQWLSDEIRPAPSGAETYAGCGRRGDPAGRHLPGRRVQGVVVICPR